MLIRRAAVLLFVPISWQFKDPLTKEITAGLLKNSVIWPSFQIIVLGSFESVSSICHCFGQHHSVFLLHSWNDQLFGSLGLEVHLSVVLRVFKMSRKTLKCQLCIC